MSDDFLESDAYLDVAELIDPSVKYTAKKVRVAGSFWPVYNAQLIELMAHGHTFTGACGRLGIPLSRAKRWLLQYDDWAEAKEIGEQVRQYKLEVALNANATGQILPQDLQEWQEKNPDKPFPLGNLRAIMFSLKTVHQDDYSEKVITEEKTTHSDAEKTPEALNVEITRELETLRRSLDDGGKAGPARKEKGRPRALKSPEESPG